MRMGFFIKNPPNAKGQSALSLQGPAKGVG
jgi:hypothetical protein